MRGRRFPWRRAIPVESPADAVLAAAGDVIVAFDTQGVVTAWNPAAERATGLRARDALGRAASEVLPGLPGDLLRPLRSPAKPERERVFKLALEHPRGATPTRLVCRASTTHDATGVVVVGRHSDVVVDSERDGSETPSDDDLTGAASRRAFCEHLSRAARRPPGPRTAVLAVLDLDGFRCLNESLGHEVGDAVLREVVARLRHAVRAGDVVGRLGGDEFGILIDDVEAAVGLRTVERLTRVFHVPFESPAHDHPLHLTASIGVTLVRSDSDVTTALREAGIAMSAARVHGGARYEIFSAAVHEAILARRELAHALSGAAERGELLLDYQPVIDLETERVLGVEALVRWEHPEHGLMPPARFIPLAEETGAIRSLGRWVLDEACRQLAEWCASPGFADLHVAVNVSPQQLRAPDLVDEVAATLSRAGLAPRQLHLEITETALMAEPDALVGTLAELRQLGVTIALDDFGTGYSSLGRMRSLPFDVVKIDRSFVEGIARGDEHWSLVTAIVGLAQSLDKRTLAEGIEDAAQLAHVRALGVRVGQGFLFAHPLSPFDLAAQVSQRNTSNSST